MQGFLIGRPVPHDGIIPLVSANPLHADGGESWALQNAG